MSVQKTLLVPLGTTGQAVLANDLQKKTEDGSGGGMKMKGVAGFIPTEGWPRSLQEGARLSDRSSVV